MKWNSMWVLKCKRIQVYFPYIHKDLQDAEVKVVKCEQ